MVTFDFLEKYRLLQRDGGTWVQSPSVTPEAINKMIITGLKVSIMLLKCNSLQTGQLFSVQHWISKYYFDTCLLLSRDIVMSSSSKHFKVIVNLGSIRKGTWG